jgi:RNA polymerase sigma-70 factor (ECF subfamily)
MRRQLASAVRWRRQNADGADMPKCVEQVAKEPGLATFKEKVEATVPALRRYARALTHDPEIADELVEGALLWALRSEDLFNGGEVRSWLYSILINVNRSQRTIPGPSEPVVAVRDGHDIERALSELQEDQRNALLLVVLEGLTYREVAEVQGVPIDTVTLRLACARGEIKNILDGDPQRTKQNCVGLVIAGR